MEFRVFIDVIDQNEQFDNRDGNWQFVYATDPFGNFFVSWNWLAAWHCRCPVLRQVLSAGRAATMLVNISAAEVSERETAPFPLFRDPLFDQFFRDFFEPRRQRVTRTSLGSGVITRPEGYVLTNQHLILRGTRIRLDAALARYCEDQDPGPLADPPSMLSLTLNLQALGAVHQPTGRPAKGCFRLNVMQGAKRPAIF